jgi:hypothetical protein
MNKINTHTLLRDYHGRDDYPQIAQRAASRSKAVIPETGKIGLGQRKDGVRW